MVHTISHLFICALPNIATQMEEKELIEIGAVSKAVYACVSSNEFWEKHLYTQTCTHYLTPGAAKTFYLKQIKAHNLRDSLIREFQLVDRNCYFPKAIDVIIRSLLRRGADVQEKEWQDIHEFCEAKTIRMVHKLFNPLTQENHPFCCTLDYMKKAVAKQDPFELIQLKTALSERYEDEEIFALIEKMNSIDLDTLMIALQNSHSDALINELYKIFKRTDKACNINCLANYLLQSGYYSKKRDETLVKTVLQDISEIRAGAFEPEKKPGPIYDVINYGYSAEIVEMVLARIKNLDIYFLCEFRINQLSDEVLNVLEERVGISKEQYAYCLHRSIANKEDEPCILKLLNRVDHVTLECFSMALNNNYSNVLITALSRKMPMPTKVPLNMFLLAFDQGHFEACKTLIPSRAVPREILNDALDKKQDAATFQILLKYRHCNAYQPPYGYDLQSKARKLGYPIEIIEELGRPNYSAIVLE